MPYELEKSELYAHHAHRLRHARRLYFCAKCVRSYDSQSGKCRFCGSAMQPLSEGSEGKARHFFCTACGLRTDSRAPPEKCSCGGALAEAKKFSALRRRDKAEVISTKAARKLKGKLKKGIGRK